MESESAFSWGMGSQVPDVDPDSVPPAARVGTRLGHYELVESLARGSFGSVYRAWDTRLQRDVAVKVLERIGAADRARFAREARALGELRHPNLVTLHDMGEDRGLPYLVLELVEGETLAARCAPDRLLPVPDAARFVAEIARGLEHAHRQGIFHRDVKPSNVLIEAGRAKLVDFGLAFLDGSRAERLSRTGAPVGSPAFMAPEQARGAPPDARTDVYGLGATLYQALCGRLPLEGGEGDPLVVVERHVPEPPSRFRGGVPAALDAICARCLAKAPAERFARAGELAAALDEALRPPARPAGRRPWLAGLAAAVLLGGLSGRALSPGATAPSPSPSPDAVDGQAELGEPDDEAAARALLAQARRAGPGRAGDEAATALYAQAEELAPPALRREVWSEWAWHHTYRTRFRKALRLAERALAAGDAPVDDARRISLLRLRAICLANLYRAEEAHALEAQVVDADPGGVDGLLVRLWAVGEDLDRSAALAERVLLLDPLHVDGWLALGYVALQRGDLEQAWRAYSRAAELEPRDVRAEIGLISIRFGQGRGEEALTRVQRLADELGDECPAGVLGQRVRIQLAFGREDEAEADLTRLLSRRPNAVPVLFWRGLVRRRRGDAEGARADLTRAALLSWDEFEALAWASCSEAEAEALVADVAAAAMR